MGFIPLDQPRKATDARFPRVSDDEQAARDVDAERLVRNELDQDMPDDSRAALEQEYAQRFGKDPSTAQPNQQQRGFIPIANADEQRPARGFIPLESSEPSRGLAETIAPAVKTAQAIGQIYPVAETAANLITQGAALPIAGIAGLGAAATKAMGLTDADPADVVHAVGGALTYQPVTDLGKHLTQATMLPFEKLAEAGQYAGNKTLDATGSPIAATAVDTAINALPMVIAPAAKGAKRAMSRPAEIAARIEPAVRQETGRGFIPLKPESVREANATAIEPRAQRVAGDDSALLRAELQELPEIRRSGDSGFHPLADELSAVPARHGPGAESGALAGAVGREGQLRARELPLDDAAGAGAPESVLQTGDHLRAGSDGSRGGEIARAAEQEFGTAQSGEWVQPGRPASGEALQALDDSGIQGRNLDPAAAGEPGRNLEAPSSGSTESRMVDRAGAESSEVPQPKAARYALIEAENLKASHDTNLRPVEENTFGRQDAPRHESEAAVQDIVRDFDPARLADSVDDATGAPIVARDGVVEAGQRRAIALQRVYQANGAKAETYRQHLRENAERFGIDPGAIDGMKKPVLVRVPDEAAPRRTGVAMPDDGTVNSFAPGASYVGFVDDTPRPGLGGADAVTPADAPARASARPEPIRREDILIPFIKALDTSIYEGRVRGKGKMGFFRPKTEEVRIKRHADLETASHELAHLLDKRIPEIRKSWESGTDWQIHRKELQGVSYDNKKIYEGFAEFVRLHMTQPEVARAKAPTFSKWFEDFTERHEYGPAIKKAQAGMQEWYGQDAVDRARSKIGKHVPLSDALDGGWDKWRQSVLDDLHGVYRMERETTGGIAPAGAYETARLARASHSIADGALRFGAPVKKADGSFGWKGKGLEEILKPVAQSLDDALLYFVGRSAHELMTQGREHLFSPGEIDGMLRLKKPEFDQAFKEYQAWNKGVLDFAEAHGVINPEARALWQRTQYMPFQRIGQPGGFKGKPGDWSGVKALTGGTENIRDILANMTGNAAQLIDKAVKNEARLKIAELADTVEGGGKFMAKIPAESRPVRIDSKQVIDALLKNMGIDSSTTLRPAVAKAVKDLRKELEGAPAMLELMQTSMPPAGGTVVAVLKGGKPVWYEVADPLLFRALQSIDRPLQSAVVKFLGIPKRIGQMTITLTPDFMLANIARDTIMGSVMSRAGFRPVVDSLNGMRLRLTNDPIYKEAIANGMGMSSMFLDETRFKAKLEKFYQRQGIDYRTVLDAPAKIGNFLETLADSFEMSTRLGEYKRAVDAGEHPRHAAYLGRDVSTDFAMKGDSAAAGFMFDTVMFLRPALVSWDRLYRGIAHDPNRMAIAAKTGTLAMMSMALYLLNKDEPRYQDLQDWDRDTNWHFFVSDQHFRYPKIWEVGAVASIAERTAEKVINEDPQGLGKDFARILGSTFNINWKPQILAPLYEQATNRSGFTAAPIETPGMENMQPFLRAKPTTSETMKALGMATKNMPESLQLNPARGEQLLRGYFNTFAMYGLMLTDKAMFGDKLPEARTDQLPVVRRFYSQEPPLHTKFETQFYDMLGEAKRLHGTMRQLDGMGRPDIADVKEKEPLSSEAKPLERAAKNLGGINKDMLAVRRSDATWAEKRQKLDELTVERNALIKAAVQESKAAQAK